MAGLNILGSEREREGRKKGLWFILIVLVWLVIAPLAHFCLHRDE